MESTANNNSKGVLVGALVCLGIAIVTQFMSNFLFFLYLPLYLVVIILAIVMLAKGRVKSGVLTLLAGLLVPLVVFALNVFIVGAFLVSKVNAAEEARQKAAIQQAKPTEEAGKNVAAQNAAQSEKPQQQAPPAQPASKPRVQDWDSAPAPVKPDEAAMNEAAAFFAEGKSFKGELFFNASVYPVEMKIAKVVGRDYAVEMSNPSLKNAVQSFEGSLQCNPKNSKEIFLFVKSTQRKVAGGWEMEFYRRPAELLIKKTSFGIDGQGGDFKLKFR